jgi:hypothetical protein
MAQTKKKKTALEKVVWTEEKAKQITALSFGLWLNDQIANDTIYHAECFLQGIREKTTLGLYKAMIERYWQAWGILAYGPEGRAEFDSFPDTEQELIRITSRMMASVLTDAPVQPAVN